MTQIEQIKAEIDRRLKNPHITFHARAELLELIDFLSTIDEQPSEDLKKVVMIDNVFMNMTAEGYNNGYKTRPFYEEALRRINERKENEL